MPEKIIGLLRIKSKTYNARWTINLQGDIIGSMKILCNSGIGRLKPHGGVKIAKVDYIDKEKMTSKIIALSRYTTAVQTTS